MALPASGYLSDPNRTVGEMQQALEDQRDVIDSSASEIAIDVSGGTNVILSDEQSRYKLIRLTGAITADIALIVPDVDRFYSIVDESTGAFSLTVKTSAGSGVVLFWSSAVVSTLRCDGTDVFRLGTDAESVEYDGSDVKTALDGLAGGFTTKAIGERFELPTEMTGVVEPDNSGSAKFVKLTQGLDGVGQFNEGLLINETVTGSGSTLEVTAEIAVGPNAGDVINLWNSENRYPMPGETSGAVANDQMQQITGSLTRVYTNGNTSGSGALNQTQTASNILAGGTTQVEITIGLDSANSPNARTGDHTNVKHQQATYYMRIA